MRLLVFCVIAIIASNLALRAEDMAVVRAADGFQLPVGPSGTAAGYYVARGFRPNGHLGEDWNGVGGGDTDLGDPVYAAAHGIVVFARNYHVGWGNVVIIRHAYYEGSELKYCDSLYGHLLDFTVQEGEQVHRGQQIGRIGNNFGMYEAHLHFEMRKNIQIGMYRSSFPRDFTNYFTPTEFVTSHHICPKGNHMVNVPINTFPAVPPPVLPGPHVETPMVSVPPPGSPGRLAKIAPLPQTPGASLPVFRTSKTYAAAATPTPTPAPEPAATKKELAAAAPVTPTPTPLGKHSKAAAPTVIAAASPTPSVTSKHGKKLAAAATPEPKPVATSAATSVDASVAAPTVKLADDSSADESAPTASSTPPPSSSKHSRKLASAPAQATQKILQFQPVADTSPPAPKVATTDPSDAPVTPKHTPSPAKSSRSKKVIATATPEPAPQTAAATPELTADSMALPTSDLSQARSSNSPTLEGPDKIATSAAASATKKSDSLVDLIPEPIAARATPAPTHRTRRSSPTPSPGSHFIIVNGTQVVAPQPILPAPSADAAPVRPVGSSYKIDRYEDLRGNLGY